MRLTQIDVNFRCDDPDDINTCSRNPPEAFYELRDERFTLAAP